MLALTSFGSMSMVIYTFVIAALFLIKYLPVINEIIQNKSVCSVSSEAGLQYSDWFTKSTACANIILFVVKIIHSNMIITCQLFCVHRIHHILYSYQFAKINHQHCLKTLSFPVLALYF